MGSIGKVIASVAAFGLVVSSTAAAAAAPAPVPTAQTQAPNAWLMLSALSAGQSVGLANAAAQPADVPPPPPPPGAPPGAMSEGAGPLVAIAIWFALIALALTISGPSGRPNSPA